MTYLFSCLTKVIHSLDVFDNLVLNRVEVPFILFMSYNSWPQEHLLTLLFYCDRYEQIFNRLFIRELYGYGV
jgi:hypothetical protein